MESVRGVGSWKVTGGVGRWKVTGWVGKRKVTGGDCQIESDRRGLADGKCIRRGLSDGKMSGGGWNMKSV